MIRMGFRGPLAHYTIFIIRNPRIVLVIIGAPIFMFKDNRWKPDLPQPGLPRVVVAVATVVVRRH